MPSEEEAPLARLMFEELVRAGSRGLATGSNEKYFCFVQKILYLTLANYPCCFITSTVHTLGKTTVQKGCLHTRTCDITHHKVSSNLTKPRHSSGGLSSPVAQHTTDHLRRLLRPHVITDRPPVDKNIPLRACASSAELKSCQFSQRSRRMSLT